MGLVHHPRPLNSMRRKVGEPVPLRKRATYTPGATVRPSLAVPSHTKRLSQLLPAPGAPRPYRPAANCVTPSSVGTIVRTTLPRRSSTSNDTVPPGSPTSNQKQVLNAVADGNGFGKF